MDVLYHYTSKYHLQLILNDGFLKLTESNLIAPDGTFQTELKSKNYKPVVWLTDSEITGGNGLEGSMADKTEIKITVRKKPDFQWWHSWSRKNQIDKSWAKALEQGNKSKRWFISEKIVTMEDILKIEDTYTGEVYYNKEK
jgi:hypothetical protein